MGHYQFLFFEILRNFCLLIISGIYPLKLSFNKNKDFSLPIFTTKECARNFNLVLINEKSYNSFSKFLENFSQDGLRLLFLWMDLNIFKNNSINSNKKIIISSDIFEKYIKEYSEFYIDIPGDIIQNIEFSYRNIAKNLYDDSFDELMDFTFNNLKNNYFPVFLESEEYKKLEEDLRNEEIIYSRLLGSSTTINDLEMV